MQLYCEQIGGYIDLTLSKLLFNLITGFCSLKVFDYSGMLPDTCTAVCGKQLNMSSNKRTHILTLHSPQCASYRNVVNVALISCHMLLHNNTEYMQFDYNYFDQTSNDKYQMPIKQSICVLYTSWQILISTVCEMPAT